tara:strand:- start:527 stop:1603 length:1077 start_codon:yes stop_codon:yes gene_type:complete
MIKSKFSKINMKAAILFKNKNKLEIIDEIKIPKVKQGQVLVKLSYSGVCHSQIMEIKGLRGKDKFLPHMLGHEGCGKVIEIGKKVSKVKKNDWVILSWIKGSGCDVSGGQYKYKNKIINSGPVTTFSTYSIVSENRLVKLPKSVSKKEAVLYGCALPTGAGMIFNQTNLNTKSSIAIIGVGGIGLISLISAKLMNCKNIIAIDTNNYKLKMAKKFGATEIINSKKTNVLKRIDTITKNQRLDYSIECAGKIETIEMAFNIINAKKGECLFCSHPPYGKKIKIDPFELILGKKISGSWGGSVRPDRDIPKFAALYKKNKISFNKLISKKYSLDKINNAIDDLIKGKVLRPLIVIDKSLK